MRGQFVAIYIFISQVLMKVFSQSFQVSFALHAISPFPQKKGNSIPLYGVLTDNSP